MKYLLCCICCTPLVRLLSFIVSFCTSKGLRGHKGTNGTTCGKRLAKYGRWRVQCSELIAYGVEAAVEVIMQLVVDDGVADRSHRIHLFGMCFQVALVLHCAKIRVFQGQ